MYFEEREDPYYNKNRNIGGTGGGSDFYKPPKTYVGKYVVHMVLPLDVVREIDAFASNNPQIGTRTNAVIKLTQIAFTVIKNRGKIQNPEIRDQLEAEFEQGTIVDWLKKLTRKEFNALDSIFQTEYQQRVKVIDDKEQNKRALKTGGSRMENTQRWLEYKQEKEEIQYLKDQYEHQDQDQDQSNTTTDNNNTTASVNHHDNDNDNRSTTTR
jgi:hypothetical protein